MFREGTLFVIGAGASCELGLPSGDALRGSIAQRFAIDPSSHLPFENRLLSQTIAELAEEESRDNSYELLRMYVETAKIMRTALPIAPSIDNYLQAHSANSRVVTLGKIGIAQSIIAAEASAHTFGGDEYSHLLAQQHPPLRHKPISKGLQASWYIPFFQTLVSEVPVERLESIFTGVKFIIFNYDRCFEYILHDALMRYYNISDIESASVVNACSIIHPYGRVGRLPWQDGNDQAVSFGSDQNYNLRAVAGSIRTFSEAIERGIAKQMQNAVRRAETMVFLGFGFLEQNLQLLSTGASEIKRVFATTLGISSNDVPILKEMTGRMIDKACVRETERIKHSANFYMITESGPCRALMDNNRFRLRFE